MPKSKHRPKPRQAGGAVRRGGGTGQWVALALVVGLALGGVAGYFVGRAMPAGPESAALADAYGRAPGHPHYNHNHR